MLALLEDAGTLLSSTELIEEVTVAVGDDIETYTNRTPVLTQNYTATTVMG